MAELGYQRSAKKCKEKFENVYKYHKRTKDGRSSKSDGKTYRFFDQLEALDQLQPFQMLPWPPVQQTPVAPHSKGMPFLPQPLLHTPTTISFKQQPCNNSNPNTTAHVAKNPNSTLSQKFQSGTTNFMVSTSSSTSSDDFQQQQRSGRKRKWKDFFEKLMRDVVDKQEELQTKFLRTIEMRDRERSMREEAWRMQEMERLNHEHEILVHERSAAAAKDAALIAFLQKIAGQPSSVVNLNPTQTVPSPSPPPPPQAPQRPKPVNDMKPDDNNDHNKMIVCRSVTPQSSSRWPKAEVEDLIKLRTSFEIKYQETGPKGPFWEEISAGMRSLGYNRNAKRCKEKWENINKYFKKVKESNKQRPEDSKTCPYYNLLEAIYKEKKGFNGGDYNYPTPASGTNSLMAPIMVQPEQQWPLAPQTLAALSHSQNPNNEAEDDMLDEDELDQEMEDEEDQEGEKNDNNDLGGTYEVVATASNNTQHGTSATTTGSMETSVA